MKPRILPGVFIGMLFPVLAFSQPGPRPEEADAVAMITQIYSDVSAENAGQVDWEKIRSNFVEEAVIVLKTSRDANSQFTLDEFIQDFKDFYQTPAAMEHGFQEEVVKLKAEVHKDLAFIAVVYAAGFPKAERPPSQGIDFWLLTRKENGWKIVAVTNEIVLPGEELPDLFE